MTHAPVPVLVRQAQWDDVDTIVAFNAAMALETENRRLDPAQLREGVRTLLATPEHGFYVLAEIPEIGGHRVAGQLMITFEWSDWRNGLFWWIQSVYVAPAQRRKGIFRALQQHILTKAQADPQICGIRLYVDQDNRHAQTVYERMGLAQSRYMVFEQDFVFSGQSRSQT